MTFELRIKIKQSEKYLGQRPSGSKVIVWTHRHTHTSDRSITLSIALSIKVAGSNDDTGV